MVTYSGDDIATAPARTMAAAAISTAGKLFGSTNLAEPVIRVLQGEAAKAFDANLRQQLESQGAHPETIDAVLADQLPTFREAFATALASRSGTAGEA